LINQPNQIIVDAHWKIDMVEKRICKKSFSGQSLLMRRNLADLKSEDVPTIVIIFYALFTFYFPYFHQKGCLR
jgi:type II secretory pathway predicted ATPase ExeA